MDQQQQQMPPEPPPLMLMKMITGKWLTQAIGAAAELGIADQLAAGPRSSEDLARACNASEDGVFRLLRALASLGIFAETEPRVFTLTPMASCLRSDVPGSLAAAARFFAHESTWKPWGHATDSVRSGRESFSKVMGAPVFEYVRAHPEVAAVFNAAMTSLSTMDSEAVAAAYDFSGIGTLVDVAGGHGLLLATVLEKNPSMRGLLFELPHAIEGAKQLFAARGVASRCETATGDFFQAVPAGGDAYVMKHIIHDWDDASCIQLLKRCHQAMKPGSKLLVVDAVIERGNGPQLGKLLDLEMLVLTSGGRERDASEFAKLYAAAGFELTRIIPTHAPASIVEGVRV